MTKLIKLFLSNPFDLFKRIYFVGLFILNNKNNTKYCRSYYSPFFRSNYSDQTFKYYIVGAYGNYFSNFLNNSEIDVFFDIGANQGLYSILAAKNDNISKVYSFEPNKSIFKLLEENISYNACISKVNCINLGISNEARFVELTIPINHSGAGEIISNLDQHKYSSQYTVERIEVVDFKWLDENIEISKKSKIGVKIDVEGHELFVIETLMKAKIWQNIDWIFWEVNPIKLEIDQILILLKEDGFHEVTRISKDDNQYDILMKR